MSGIGIATRLVVLVHLIWADPLGRVERRGGEAVPQGHEFCSARPDDDVLWSEFTLRNPNGLLSGDLPEGVSHRVANERKPGEPEGSTAAQGTPKGIVPANRRA